MGGSFLLAWLTGEAIICYRSVKVQGGPPWPGQLLAGSAAFAVLAILAEAGPDARRVALTIAWGLNAAGFLALYTPATGQQNTAGAAMGSLTGTNAANKGWWGNVTAPGGGIKNTAVLAGRGNCISSGTLA